MLLTELNNKVLLDVLSYLNLTDTINLAKTCIRLREVAEIKYNEYTTFNLRNYLRLLDYFYYDTSKVLKLETVLSHIGPYISVLATDLKHYTHDFDLSETIQKYCVNVTSLKVETTIAPVYSQWIKNLNLESLTLNASVLGTLPCLEITTLKELIVEWESCNNNRDHLNSITKEINSILERNPNINSLDIPLTNTFNYEVLANFTNLKHLGIQINNINVLDKLTTHLQMNKLTKVKIFIWRHHRYTEKLNNFLNTLYENANLKELSINGIVQKSTLRIINSFKLTSLYLRNIFFENFPYDTIAQKLPNLTHLDVNLEFRNLKLNVVVTLIKNLEKLEMFHAGLTYAVREKLQNEETIADILETSNSRPDLKLYSYDVAGAKYIGITVNK